MALEKLLNNVLNIVLFDVLTSADFHIVLYILLPFHIMCLLVIHIAEKQLKSKVSNSSECRLSDSPAKSCSVRKSSR